MPTDSVLDEAWFLHISSAPLRMKQWIHTYEFISTYDLSSNVLLKNTMMLHLNELREDNRKWISLTSIGEPWAATVTCGDYSYMAARNRGMKVRVMRRFLSGLPRSL